MDKKKPACNQGYLVTWTQQLNVKRI